MIIPFRDTKPINIFPLITFTLIFLNLAVFVYELYLMPLGEIRSFFFNWGMIPAAITSQGGSPRVLATLVTAMFIHGGWFHLIGNMLYLFIFGNNVEARLGTIGFLLFYLVCGFIASISQIAINPESIRPTIGASGAVAGVLGAYMVTYPGGRIRTFVFLIFIRMITIPAWLLLGFWFILQLLSGVGSLSDTESVSVAYWAHIGGFAIGALFMLAFNLLDPPHDD